ncbi:MAG TPA: alpha/beta hydrolase [Candidatus Saccharimonadia bacterium]|nr:alpha/beta hydrolase [Candidatus Saccharimonadia bacterium]
MPKTPTTRRPYPFRITTDPAALGLVSRQIETAFGRQHVIAPARPHHAEAMLFLHGFGSNWTVWTPLLQAATQDRLLTNLDPILIDLPGFGASQNTLAHLNSQQVASMLVEVAHRLGYHRLRVAGHSMGGFLALDLAAHHSEILSVHLVSSPYLTLMWGTNHPLQALVKRPKIGLFYQLHLFLARHDAIAQGLNTFNRWRLRSGMKPLYTVGGPAFEYGAHNGRGYDAARLWSQLRMPVYAVFGQHDAIAIPADMHQFQAILPTIQATVIAGSRHSSLVQYPHEVARALFGKLGPGKIPDSQPR